MAVDTTLILILVVVVVIILFGSSKIPQFARALGQARSEFDKGMKGEQPAGQTRSSTFTPPSDDPLILAAQKEGIDTQGKTREQIASELSWKLNKK